MLPQVLSALCLLAAAVLAWWVWRQRSSATAQAPATPAAPVRLSGSAEDWCRVLPGEDLLQHCNAQATLAEIRRQSRLAPAVFDRDLRSAVVAYAEFVQLAPASESHHHAHPGGLLAHTLEVILVALRLRNGYLLPLHAPTELIDQQRDHWTFAVFLAALLHDIGKIMTGLRLQVRDAPKAPIRRWLPMSGALTQSRATEYRIGFAPTAERDYLAHKKLALVLLHGIVTPNALAFLGRESLVLDALTQFLGAEDQSTDAAAEGAKALAEIVKQADRHSVAHNLQHGPRDRFGSASAVPLIERLMAAMRTLLAQGTALPLNRDGAAGWVFEGAIWFVAKRLADSVRAMLQKDGLEDGVPGPTKNDRLFDAWQDYGALEVNPDTGQAIWYVEVAGDGYAHRLAMLKFPLHKVFDDAARYPAPMLGTIASVPRQEADAGRPVASGGEHEPGKTPDEIPTQTADDADPPRIAQPDAAAMAPPQADERASPVARPENPANRNEIPAPRSPGGRKAAAPEPATAAAASRTQAPAPAISRAVPGVAPARPSLDRSDEFLDETDAVSMPGRRLKPKTKGVPASRGAGAVAPFAVAPRLPADKEPTNLAVAFMEWVQQGLADGSLPFNEAGAPVHFIAQGMVLVSPRIFRDFAEATQEGADAVQQQVIGAGWHVKAPGNSNILHFAVVKRDGVRAGKLSAVVIGEPQRWVNPLPPPNQCIVPFDMSVDPAAIPVKTAARTRASVPSGRSPC